MNATLAAPKPSDALVQPEGNIYLIRPLTDAATAWLTENTEGTWFGSALVVEHRFVDDLLRGMVDAGFTVRLA